ncbi:hypothetical protein RFI_33472, partial [Reticulomyxa filosa]
KKIFFFKKKKKKKKRSSLPSHQTMEPITTLSKKRLLEETDKYLNVKIPTAVSPIVSFTHDRVGFMKDMKRQISKFGWIVTSSGSYSDDIRNHMKDGLGWIGQQTSTLTNIFWNRKEETTELKEIPPPLLLIYLGIQRNLAEEFVERLTVAVSRIPPG